MAIPLDFQILGLISTLIILVFYLMIPLIRLKKIQQPREKYRPPGIREIDVERQNKSRSKMDVSDATEKLCSSCRNRISLNSIYCDSCGSKQ
jgi:hypothetical protein